MPYERNSDFGFGLGANRPIGRADPIIIDLRNTGINLDDGQEDISPDEATSVVNLRYRDGGLAPDFNYTPVGLGPTATNLPVLHVAGFRRQFGDNYLVRFRQDGWDVWDGGVWRTLGGAFPSAPGFRWRSVIVDDKIIGSNGIAKLQYWDGNILGSVQELSAEAPVAKYVTRIGRRVLAAVIRESPGAEFNPYLVNYSGDGFFGEFTDALLGAGLGELIPDGPDRSRQDITGLDTLGEIGVVFREDSLVQALQTGVGSAPFRFITQNVVGTSAPYSIANSPIGLFYLGSDFNIYLYNAEGATPVGHQIQEELRRTINRLEDVVATFDIDRMQYCLAVPTDSTQHLQVMYVLDVRNLIHRRRIKWWIRELGTLFTTIGYAQTVPLEAEPYLDDHSEFLDDDDTFIDDYGKLDIAPGLLFGGSNGSVWRSDKTQLVHSLTGLYDGVYLHDGSLSYGITNAFESKNFLTEALDVTIDRVRLHYRATTVSSVEVSISVDDGATYGAEKVYALPIAKHGSVTDWFNEATGHRGKLKLRVLTGDCVIEKVSIEPIIRGPSDA